MTATHAHPMPTPRSPSSRALIATAVQEEFIARGLLAGAVGGLIALAFARIIVEPATGVRSSHDLAANLGMACALIVFGAAMGGLLAVAFAVSYRRLGSIRPRTLARLLAADAFAALSLLPSVDYPPIPVSVGGVQIVPRIGQYLLLVGLSSALIIGAVCVGRRLKTRIGSRTATLVGAGLYGVGIAAAMWQLPAANDVTAVRLGSLAVHLVLWAAIAAVFAPLASRLIAERIPPAVVLRLDDYRDRLAIPTQTPGGCQR